jgi:hypothetical protein
MDCSAGFSILLLLTTGAPLVSSVPRLLVNNAGSDASGTVLSPQVGSSLAVWCWTEQNEATNRQWLYRNGTQIAQFSDDSATSASVYVLKYAEMKFVKILNFRSYQTSQAGRYDCRIVLTDPGTTISLPIYIGTPPKVGGINVTVSWNNTVPIFMVSWQAVTYSSSVMYNVYYTDMPQDQPVTTSTASADGLSTTFAEDIQACTTYYVWVSAIPINTQLEGPFGDRATTDTFEAPAQVATPTADRTVSNRMVGLHVSWMPPPQTSCPINSYDIQYRLATGDNLSTESTMSPPYQLRGLYTGSKYFIRVRAVSGDREGPWSDEIEQTTYNGIYMILRQLMFLELHILCTYMHE